MFVEFVKQHFVPIVNTVESDSDSDVENDTDK